jgi:hypothetical protein
MMDKGKGLLEITKRDKSKKEIKHQSVITIDGKIIPTENLYLLEKMGYIVRDGRWLSSFLAARRIFLWIGSRIPNRWDEICIGISNNGIAFFDKYKSKATEIFAFQSSIV